MALGEELRNARLRRNLTPSQVAAQTHMKIQIVEDLEREEFRRLTTPIYAKGFIRIYATHVGLNPAPLLEEYTVKFAPRAAVRPSMGLSAPLPVIEAPAPAPPEPPAEENPAAAETPPADAVPPAAEETAAEETVTEETAAEEEPEAAEQPDLLSEIRRTGSEQGSLEAGLALRTDELAPSPVITDVAQTVRTFYEETTGAARQAAGRARMTGAGWWETTRKRWRNMWRASFEMPRFQWKDLTAKHVFVLVGILILLLFIASGISRCVRMTSWGHSHARDSGAHVRALEPPAPYVD